MPMHLFSVVDLGANTANFQKKNGYLFLLQKISELTHRKFRVVNSERFTRKKGTNFLKVRRIGSQVHQKLFKSTRILSDKKRI